MNRETLLLTLQDTADWGRNWIFDFIARKTQLVSFNCLSNWGTIDVKKDGYFLVKKSLFKMLGLFFSSKLNLSCYIVSIAKTASPKIVALIRFVKFLNLPLDLH